MNIAETLHTMFPDVYRVELDKWIVGGRAYAARLDKLPNEEREAVAQLFACYGLTHSTCDKRAYRRCIDVVIRPWYPKAVQHENA